MKTILTGSHISNRSMVGEKVCGRPVWTLRNARRSLVECELSVVLHWGLACHPNRCCCCCRADASQVFSPLPLCVCVCARADRCRTSWSGVEKAYAQLASSRLAHRKSKESMTEMGKGGVWTLPRSLMARFWLLERRGCSTRMSRCIHHARMLACVHAFLIAVIASLPVCVSAIVRIQPTLFMEASAQHRGSRYSTLSTSVYR